MTVQRHMLLLLATGLSVLLPIISSAAVPRGLDLVAFTGFGRNSSLFSGSKPVIVNPLFMSAKRDSPSAQRNKAPIWKIVSSKILPIIWSDGGSGSERPLRILEVAAGCGLHTEAFSLQVLKEMTTTTPEAPAATARRSPLFKWYPTDPDAESRVSIQCYIDDHQDELVDVVLPPLALTLNANGIQEQSTASILSDSVFDLILCINMIHISPWEATLGLFKVAGESLSQNGILYCYGPYKEGGTAVESNLNFDASLKSRDPRWGVRDLERVLVAAMEQGLELKERIEMPANNLSLLFHRKPKK